MKKENFALELRSASACLEAPSASSYVLVGMVEIFSKRDVVEKVITLGQFILLATAVSMGFIASRRTSSLLEAKQASPQPDRRTPCRPVHRGVIALFAYPW